jgi:hypothetical protein
MGTMTLRSITATDSSSRSRRQRSATTAESERGAGWAAADVASSEATAIQRSVDMGIAVEVATSKASGGDACTASVVLTLRAARSSD